MNPARVSISPTAPTLPCERCGFDTLKVAELVDDNGDTCGRTMVCTACQSRRRAREDRERLRRHRTARRTTRRT